MSRRLLAAGVAVVAVSVTAASVLLTAPQVPEPLPGPAAPVAGDGADPADTSPVVLDGVGELAVTCVTGRSVDAPCLERQLVAETIEYGPQQALSSLVALGRIDAAVQMSCHEHMHRIGETAEALFGTLDEAYAVGNGDCQFGYHHGLMVARAASIDAETFAAEIPTMCAYFEEADPLSYSSCIHGIGHAATARQPDVVVAVEFCDNLDREGDVYNCAAGAFMEYATGIVPGLARTEPDAVVTTCDNIDAVYLDACLREAPAFWLSVYPGDFETVAALCDRYGTTSESGQRQCYYGAGFRAAMYAGLDPVRVQELCEVGQEQLRGHCYGGAAVVAYEQLYTTDPQRAVGICAGAPEARRAVCNEVLKPTVDAYAEMVR